MIWNLLARKTEIGAHTPNSSIGFLPLSFCLSYYLTFGPVFPALTLDIDSKTQILF